MALGETLIDRAGQAHAMAGLLPLATSFAEPRRQLGYRRLKLLEPSPLGQAGTTFRGHEFHYASLIEADAEPLFEATDARHQALGALGARQGAVAGSFMHLIDRTTEPTEAIRGRATCGWSRNSSRVAARAGTTFHCRAFRRTPGLERRRRGVSLRRTVWMRESRWPKATVNVTIATTTIGNRRAADGQRASPTMPIDGHQCSIEPCAYRATAIGKPYLRRQPGGRGRLRPPIATKGAPATGPTC